MPELPEVETVRRGLEPAMVGQRIAAVDVRRDGLRWPFPENLRMRLEGQTVLGLSRRSKYILGRLSGGETFLLHLGMSGRILIRTPDATDTPGQFHHNHPAPEKHDHLVLDMANGNRITLNDARRFGAFDLVASDQVDLHPLLSALGPEPLGNAFDATVLERAFAGRRTPVKTALLDQRTVAGLGNIYVCETLWRSGISPRRLAGNVAVKHLPELVRHIRDVLAEAIEAGGSSLRDHRQTSGELGYFQHRFAVYDREGHACPKAGCSGQIARCVQSGRSSFYCGTCQR